ncbi:glycosyltransferase [Halothiobacillus diazotrophicus]|uniref:glycosyltransferase n=1 Tax=Halothiobacillus diazotrophicus TaxID=1860122 RepID=UPI0009EDF66B|nr:glycosyltransferase [Halothiobacillus diazotrophicus]
MHRTNNTTEIDNLLLSPPNEFIEKAYLVILGRHPDKQGLIHYAFKLQSGFNRIQIIGDMLCSKEANNAELIGNAKTFIKKYKIIKKLPKGTLKWRLISNFSFSDDEKFDWSNWLGSILIQKKTIASSSEKVIRTFFGHEELETLNEINSHINSEDLNEVLISFLRITEKKLNSTTKSLATPLPSAPPIHFLNHSQAHLKHVTDTLEYRPKISAVIPSYNDYEVLENCINSILKYSNNLISEIVISDDCSTNQLHKDYLETIASKDMGIPITIIRSKINKGFSANVNRGLRAAKSGSDILLLNSDTELTEFSISSLCAVARMNGGVAGARLLYPNNKIQHAGGFRNFNAPDWFEHRNRMQDRYHPPALMNYNALYCTAAALYITNETLKAVGHFDENFEMGFEDVDYCLRVWNENLPVTYVGASEIYHHESITRGKNPGKREINSQNFFWEKQGKFFKRKVTNSQKKVSIIFVTKDTGVGGGHRVIFRFADFLAGQSDRYSVQIWSLASKPDWFQFNNDVKFSQFNNFAELQQELYPLNSIKIATWWETAEHVWRSSILRGIPVWLSLDIETSYYKGRDTFNELRAWSSYAPDFTYISCYKWLSEALATDFYYHSKYVGLGVDKDIFYRTKSKKINNSVLVCARGEPLKGYPLSKSIIQNLADQGYKITAYGVDPTLVPEHINIHFKHKPGNEELRELYNTHQFFLQTSIHEGLSLPPLEAMACGCIAVITDAFGNREYIKDRENCILIQRSIEDAVSTIRSIDYETTYSKLKPGIENTLRHYDWEACYKRLDDLILNISEEPTFGITKY